MMPSLTCPRCRLTSAGSRQTARACVPHVPCRRYIAANNVDKCAQSVSCSRSHLQLPVLCEPLPRGHQRAQLRLQSLRCISGHGTAAAHSAAGGNKYASIQVLDLKTGETCQVGMRIAPRPSHAAGISGRAECHHLAAAGPFGPAQGRAARVQQRPRLGTGAANLTQSRRRPQHARRHALQERAPIERLRGSHVLAGNGR